MRDEFRQVFSHQRLSAREEQNGRSKFSEVFNEPLTFGQAEFTRILFVV